MSVVFVGVGSDTDSGGAAVSSILVPRPGGIAEGDLILILGHTEGDTGPTDDWDLDPGGAAWTRLAYSYLGTGPMQVWGKFLPASPSGNTTVEFDDPQIVLHMIQVVYRGVYSMKGAGARSLTAPSLTAQAAGRAVRFYIAATQNAIGLTQDGGQTFRQSSGSSSRFPFLISDAPCSIGPTGTAPATRSANPGSWIPFSATVVIGLNRPPNAPTLVSPPVSANIDPTIDQRFSWTFSDPDAGQSQSRADLRYTVDFGTTYVTLTTVSPNNYIDIPAGTFLDHDSIAWQVRTYDSLGQVGPWSMQRFANAELPPDAPTITYPISGGAVAAVDEVDWSAPDQDGYQVRRVADDGTGLPDTGTIYFDSGQVTDTDTRSLPLTFETNDRYEHVQVSVETAGIWSDFADVRVLVSYTPPPTPALQVSVGDDGMTMQCDWTTAAPEGDNPAATSVRLEVGTVVVANDESVVTVLNDWPNSTGLSINGSAVYPWPASGAEHCFRATAVADNGATSATEWIALFDMTVDDVV